MSTDMIQKHPLDALQMQSTVSDVAGQLSEKSKRIYGLDAKAFAIWMLDRWLSPARVTRSDMIAYRSYLAEKYAKATANRMFVVARRLLQEQVLSGHLPTNVADKIEGFKVDNETPHTALTREQAKTMLATVNQSTKKGMRDYALLTLLLRTGIRRAECAALTLGDITLSQGHHVAIIQHGKGDKRRTVKLPVDVFRTIENYIATIGRCDVSPDAPLFVAFNKGDRPTTHGMTEKTIERVVKDSGQKIGVELTPHGLRSTFVTLALEGGSALHSVQYAAGHADPRTTERYQQRKLNLDDNAVDYIKL